MKNLKAKISRKKWLLLIPVVFLLLGSAYWWQNQSQDDTGKIEYEQVSVRRDNITISQDSDGSIAFAKVNLRFGVKGSIAEILVAEGDEVQKGDIIARLYDGDYQDQYQLALANLQEAQEQEMTSLWDNELKLKNAASELERIKGECEEMELLQEAYSANELKMKRMELENKELEYKNMQNKFELQQNRGVNKDELQIKIAQENLEDTILYAPVAGCVLALSKKVGESVSDEFDFATIHENNAVKAVTKVIEYDIGQIKVGQKVYVSVEAVPDQKYAGVVSKVDSLPTTDSSGLVNYSVEIDILAPGSDLKDGMTCSVSFVIKEVQDCLIVPYKAVKIIDGQQYVTVLDENGHNVDRPVKLGFTDGTSVEVFDGLKVNETVVYLKSR